MNKKLLVACCFILGIVIYGIFQVQSPGSWDLDSLTRIDIKLPDGEQRMIVEEDSLEQVKSILEEAEWDNQEEASIEGEQIRVTLFLLLDKNMPERLVAYDIWFGETGAILRDIEKEEYGHLTKDLTLNLRNILVNKSKPGI
ncbi:hypothetical protein [Ornithinibacillus californiensis]|uniref:hypothetical protein n=1 Tax=Ornithinibacillus californiensis TaxID=161536 RepID=UPI00064DC229|nr:hypothetical protein [Ornithinibacillus californiensis]